MPGSDPGDGLSASRPVLPRDMSDQAPATDRPKIAGLFTIRGRAQLVGRP